MIQKNVLKILYCLALCYWLPLSQLVVVKNETPASAAHSYIDCYLDVFFDLLVFFIFMHKLTEFSF